MEDDVNWRIVLGPAVAHRFAHSALDAVALHCISQNSANRQPNAQGVRLCNIVRVTPQEEDRHVPCKLAAPQIVHALEIGTSQKAFRLGKCAACGGHNLVSAPVSIAR